MYCHAEGLLQHHFWGDYRASLVLVFDCADMLEAVLASGKFKTWERSKKRPLISITWFGSSKELDSIMDELVICGAEREKIDSIATSIDYGEPFEVKIDVEDPKQVNCFSNLRSLDSNVQRKS